jgi:hypothetical protein
MAFLAGAAQYGAAQAELNRQQTRRTFTDEDTCYLLDIEGVDGEELTIAIVPGEDFEIAVSNIKGCKPTREIRLLDVALVNEIEATVGRSHYAPESHSEITSFWSYRFEGKPLLFERASKDGDLVPSFIASVRSIKLIAL